MHDVESGLSHNVVAQKAPVVACEDRLDLAEWFIKLIHVYLVELYVNMQVVFGRVAYKDVCHSDSVR